MTNRGEVHPEALAIGKGIIAKYRDALQRFEDYEYRKRRKEESMTELNLASISAEDLARLKARFEDTTVSLGFINDEDEMEGVNLDTVETE